MMPAVDLGCLVLHKLMAVSAQAAVLVVLIVVAQRVFRRALTPAMRYALWLLVAVRLVLAVAPESGLSVFNLLRLEAWSGATASVARPEVPAVAVDAAVGAMTAPMLFADKPDQVLVASGRTEAVGVAGGVAGKGRSAGFAKLGTMMFRAGLVVWLCVAVFLACRLLAGHCRLAWHIRRKRPVTDQAILNILEDSKVEMGVRVPVSLILSDRVSTPALMGFLRPRLIVPEGHYGSLSVPEWRHVFLHEMAHVRRMDVLVAWGVEWLKVVHWFNPLVHWAFGRMRAEREMACDALALGCCGGREGRAYGETLLRFLDPARPVLLAPAFMGILEKGGAIRRRIELIAGFASARRPTPFVAAALILLFAVTALTNAHHMEGSGGPSYADRARWNFLRLSGERELDPLLTQFVEMKWQQAQALAQARGEAVPAGIRDFLAAARQGDWLTAAALFRECGGGSGTPLWYVAQEADLAFEQFLSWDGNGLRRYADRLLSDLGDDAVLFTATDAGHGIATAFVDTRPGSNAIVIAQNALANADYLEYLRFRYGSRLQVPGPEELRQALAEASGPEAGLKAGHALAERMFAASRDRLEFFVEAGDPAPWMRPHLVPHGMVMKLSRGSFSGAFPETVTETDRRLWNACTNELLNRVGGEPGVGERATYARMRSGVAGLFEWRGMRDHAEWAYQQARLIHPMGSEPALRLSRFYEGEGKRREALAVLLDLKRHQDLPVDGIDRRIERLSRSIADNAEAERARKSGVISPAS